MGIRGTVRRSTDSFFVHCNVDTDVIVWEGDSEGAPRRFVADLSARLTLFATPDPDLKPPEIQTLIENFCLGTRRLHLYGSPRSLRRGWLTVPSASSPSFSAESPVPPVENEGSAEEQRERWGAPREWSREEWEGRWKRPLAPGSMVAEGKGPELLGKVDTLLPFVEGESKRLVDARAAADLAAMVQNSTRSDQSRRLSGTVFHRLVGSDGGAELV
jgi:mRNA (2'-O-methyladenosine-N6-)-methyltransferase